MSAETPHGRRTVVTLALLAGSAVAAVLASVMLGSVRLAPTEVLAVFSGSGDDLARMLVLDLR
ncbi:MAG TPA: hypothetical protein VK855_04125, partial [Thioalkalivibrio sp.]|nr:hypothetical protein [Thioalkalivibrio sp.]